MSRNLSGIGDSKILQRKIPQNTRYRNVGARVDTGSSVSRYTRRIEEMQTNYRYRKNELFKRMKVTTFAQLVLQVANISMQDDDASISDLPTARSEATSVATLNGNHDLSQDRQNTTARSEATSVATLNGNHDPDDTSGGEKNVEADVDISSPRSTLQSVIRGVGEADLSPNKLKSDRIEANNNEDDERLLSKPYTDCPYLLLDVRDKDEFERCHITGAVNFPIAMLSRTMNNFTREILEFKNCSGKVILLYDEDERLAPTAATTMVERGFDNIFIISGGLKVIGQKIPQGLVNGSLPQSCVPDYISKRLKNNRATGSREEFSNVYASQHIHRFSAEDLDKINHYLDESLIPNDTGSRLSRQSKASTYRSDTMSKVSSMSSSSTFSTGSRRPWK